MNLKTLIAVVLFTQGCATLHNGRHQSVSVTSDPAGATVDVHCGKAQPPALTPATLRLPRKVEECSIVLSKPGFQSETVVFDTSVSRWFWANFAGPIIGGASGATRHSDLAFIDFLAGAFVGGVGFAVDAITGAMWELEPARVERKLVPK
ncbi:MAG TPA: hypothetical protein VF787_23520 [Thermoanaerobaculia bacterium]